jgi:hypothetical protein
MLPPDTVLPLQLQPDSGSSCNRCTLRVANTESFYELQPLYHFVVATGVSLEL